MNEEPSYVYHKVLSTMESTGWKAVFVERHDSGFPYLAEEPLVGWATVEVHAVFEEKQSDIVVDVETVGMVARGTVEEAELMDNFMGYIGPGEDRNVFLDEIPEVLSRSEAPAEEEEEEHESHED
jgi:hypothetical protein